MACQLPISLRRIRGKRSLGYAFFWTSLHALFSTLLQTNTNNGLKPGKRKRYIRRRPKLGWKHELHFNLRTWAATFQFRLWQEQLEVQMKTTSKQWEILQHFYFLPSLESKDLCIPDPNSGALPIQLARLQYTRIITGRKQRKQDIFSLAFICRFR